MFLPCINNETSYQRTFSGKQRLCCEFGNLNPTIEFEETIPAHSKMKCSSSKRWQKVFIKNASKISFRTSKMSYVFISSFRYNGLFIYLFIYLNHSKLEIIQKVSAKPWGYLQIAFGNLRQGITFQFLSPIENLRKLKIVFLYYTL